MNQAELARRANAAADASRRVGAPVLREDSGAEDIAAWLQWCDPNGAHTAALAAAEDMDPYSLADAWDALARMLEDA